MSLVTKIISEDGTVGALLSDREGQLAAMVLFNVIDPVILNPYLEMVRPYCDGKVWILAPAIMVSDLIELGWHPDTVMTLLSKEM